MKKRHYKSSIKANEPMCCISSVLEFLWLLSFFQEKKVTRTMVKAMLFDEEKNSAIQISHFGHSTLSLLYKLKYETNAAR